MAGAQGVRRYADDDVAVALAQGDQALALGIVGLQIETVGRAEHGGRDRAAHFGIERRQARVQVVLVPVERLGDRAAFEAASGEHVLDHGARARTAMGQQGRRHDDGGNA
ncbi:MAG: hypothetical protein WDN04_11595 [Rhodospirillales bacterium]